MSFDVDLRAVRFLIAASEEGSLTEAARRLHFSQPGLSVQIRHLERHLGTPLLVRDHRGVTLTPAGEVAVREGRRLLRLAESFHNDVRALAGGAQPQLRLQFHSNGAAELMPLLIRGFEQRRPDVKLLLHEFDLADPLAGLRDGTTDALLLRLPLDGTEDLAVMDLFSEPRVVALSRDHRLATHASVKAEDLLDERWVVGMPSGTSRDFWTLQSYRRSPATIISEGRSVAELWPVVASGRAVLTCPASAVRYENRPELAFVPIEDVEPSVCALAWHPDNARPELRALIEAAEHACRHLPPELEPVTA